MNMQALYNMSYGVYVVSTYDGCAGRSTGCTANSAIQVTSDPATIAVSVNHLNHTNKCIMESGKFNVSILAQTSLPLIIGTFGFRSGRDIDKFEKFESVELNGVKGLKDSCAVLACEVIDKFETETHTVFLGRLVDAETFKTDAPMTYAYYHNVIKGRTAKNAPTYVAP